MKFGIEFVPNVKPYEIEYLTSIAEDSGFDSVWITDHYNNRNSYSILTLLAIRTVRLSLGVGVSNPLTVHPAIIASAMATINELSMGRAILGIAAGDKTTLQRLGVEWDKPLTRVKEAVEVIKELISGKRVNYSGKTIKVNNAGLDYSVSPYPIYIGAQGPKMLKLASEIGDGVLINASHPKDFKEAFKCFGELKEGFDVVAYTSMSVDKDREKAKESAKIVVAFIVAGSPEIVLNRHGITEKAKAVREALNRAFAGGSWADVRKTVSEDMVDTFSISGTPEDVVSRIEELKKAGVTHVVAGSPIGSDRAKAIKLIGKKVIPAFS
ncbi:MAG: 5,10-methylenetetrahydromethanopterin reductase [Archaeoglobus sp.]|nr:MAG: 5,10-methylenetetrahydromethanopterin reductase [Archaeoglobus sp.]